MALPPARQLCPAILDIVCAVKTAHPMDVLRTAVSALAAFDAEVGDNSRAATARNHSVDQLYTVRFLKHSNTAGNSSRPCPIAMARSRYPNNPSM